MDLWKSFRHKVHIAHHLSLRDWLDLTKAWWALLGFYLALRWMRFNDLDAFNHPVASNITDSSSVWTSAKRLQRLVDLASRLHLLSMTCLVQAFTLRWMLGKRRIPAQIIIGANKSLAGIHAHAWVEVGGKTIGESEDVDERFKVLKPTGKTLS